MKSLNRLELETIVKGIPAAVLVIEKNGAITFSNDYATALFGVNLKGLITPNQTQKVKFLSLSGKPYPLEDLPARKALAKGIEVNDEFLVERLDGTIVAVRGLAKPVENEDGKIIAAVGIYEDITERKKSLEILKENQERLELAQRVARLGSWEVFVKEDRAIWSREMFNLFGLEPTDAPNVAAYSKLIHPDDLKTVAATMEAFLAKGRLGDTVNFDYRIIHPDKEACFLHSERLISEVDETGKVEKIVGIEQDITERKLNEDALSFERSRLQAVVDNLPVGLMLVDTTGKALVLNKVLNAIWHGSKPLEHFKHYEQYLAWDNKTGKRVPPEEWPVSVSLRTGQPSGEFEFTIERFDGSKGIILTSAVPIKDVRGRIVGGVGIAQDITERKRAENALKASEERFRLVAQAAKVLVHELDIDTGTVRVLSGEDVLGYTKHEMPTSIDWWFEQIHPSDLRRFQDQTNEGIIAGKDFLLEYRVRRKAGDYIIVHDTMRAIRDSKGGIRHLIGGLRDVTKRKGDEAALLRSKELLEEKAAEIEKYASSMEDLAQQRLRELKNSERLAAIGATAGMVGHDIRNPLQAIVSDLFLLKDSLSSMPECVTKNEVTESLDSIDKNITYINKIVLDLQDYSRTLTPEYSILNLKSLVQNVISTLSIPDNIKVKDEAAYIELRTDAMYARRVLTNLITNAVQAMPAGGTLTIKSSADEKENKVVLIVEDTGIGIPEDVKPKLFTPMMTTKSKGQGLGLAVVKRLVEALHGNITFESQEGKGTKFTIELPIS